MQEILDKTFPCRFDLCHVGHLQNPGNFLRKRMEVLSTSNDLKHSLHQHFCKGDHHHQPIAGQVQLGNNRVALSQFSEMYPRKFARQVARTICHDVSKPILVGTHENDSSDDHPTKKRRLGHKMNAKTIEQRFSGVNWQTVMKLADTLAPRVGTMTLEQGMLVSQVQSLWPIMLSNM